MSAFVGNDRLQREVLRIRIALKRLGVDGEEIVLLRAGEPVLGTPSETVDMQVADPADKSEAGSDSAHAPPACPGLPNGDRHRLALGHSSSLRPSVLACKRSGLSPLSGG